VSYFDAIDPWVRPAKLLEAMLPMMRENPRPLMGAIKVYREGANKAHDKWLKRLADSGIEVKENDPFRIPPFTVIQAEA
jgi:hypothetical protein